MPDMTESSFDQPDPTLDRVQYESDVWRRKAYPDTVDDTLSQLAGVTEEVGELAHALLKHKQGIRGYDTARMVAEAGDAMADAIIYMCGIATTLGLNLADELSKAWAHVKARNIVQNSNDLGRVDPETGIPAGEITANPNNGPDFARSYSTGYGDGENPDGSSQR
jgi:NTP pyrophosphatase (non-canonical NTP hydrolase)